MIYSPIYRRALLITASVLISAGLFMAAAGSVPPPHHSLPGASNQQRSKAILNAYGKLPLAFEVNQGQADSSVRFLSHGYGYSLFFTESGPVLAFGNTASQSLLQFHFAGASSHPQVVGLNELPGKTNYFLGNDPHQWLTNVPTYARVLYRNVYPGVDLVYYGNQGKLEYDFVLAPGANLHTIEQTFEGSQNPGFDGQGNLLLHLGSVAFRQEKPVVYQEIQGVRHVVESHYVLVNPHQVGFAVASYDPRFPLIIDPVLVYSTYLGGNFEDLANAITVDSAGNVYVTGETSSANFPRKHAFQPKLKGPSNAFVTKLNASGSALVYSTYLGGSGQEYGHGIAVDSAGNAYVTGGTNSTDFPTVNPLQGHLSTPPNDAYITKFDTSGQVVYSTYLGGNNNDQGYAIAADNVGNAYVTGYTASTDFPLVHPFQGKLGGQINAFIATIAS